MLGAPGIARSALPVAAQARANVIDRCRVISRGMHLTAVSCVTVFPPVLISDHWRCAVSRDVVHTREGSDP